MTTTPHDKVLSAALRLVLEYDNLLRHWGGEQQVLLEGDVAEIDAAYDKMIAAVKSALHAPIPEAGNGGDVWLDIASAPKDSPIIAISWQDGYGSFESKWSKPEVYEWDEMHSYWANKQRGTCIWPKYQDRYRCKSLGRAPSPPSPSNEGEKQT